MFFPDPSLKHVAATRGQVVSVIQSLNHPQVGVPGFSNQAAQCTIVGLRNDNRTFSILVHLHLLESGKPVIYSYIEGEFDVERYPSAETQAIEFVESMGFMLDNLNFRNLSPLQQEELMLRLVCFDPNPPARAPSGESGRDGGEEDLATSSDRTGSPAGLRIIDETEDVDDLEELEALEELEELEPLDLPSRFVIEEIPGVAPEFARRVVRLLASF